VFPGWLESFTQGINRVQGVFLKIVKDFLKAGFAHQTDLL
jgi:hypothetical protein